MAITNVTARILRYKSRLESCDSSFYSSNKCVHTKNNLGSTDNTITYFWPLKFEKYRFFTKICKFSNTVFAGSITRLPIIGPVSCRIFPVQKKAPTAVLKFYVRNFMNHPYQKGRRDGIQTVTEREGGEKKIFLLVPFHRIL
jgi:hypothetical protein